jgi:TolA-binding protein
MTRTDSMGELEVLVEQARRAPAARTDDGHREAMRAQLLAAADATGGARSPRAPWIVAGVAMCAAAAAAVLVVTRGGAAPGAPVTPAPQVDVSAVGPADYDRAADATSGADVVHLRAGRIRIAAPRTTRIEVGAAAVEADGTYEIAADRGAIAEVTVVKGHAAIRVAGQQPVFLAAGQTWKPTVETAVLATAPAVPAATSPIRAIAPAPAPAPAPVRPRNTAAVVVSAPALATAAVSVSATAPDSAQAASPPSETESRFQEGWSLLKAGHFNDAAQQLGAAVDADPSSPLAEDARYFQAVALARAGKPGDAEHVLTTFLDRNPRSLRRGRASVMLGWLLAQRGERDAARGRFEDATGDPDAQVAASAHAGLAALDRP